MAGIWYFLKTAENINTVILLTKISKQYYYINVAFISQIGIFRGYLSDKKIREEILM